MIQTGSFPDRDKKKHSRRRFTTMTALAIVSSPLMVTANPAGIARDDFEQYIALFNTGNSAAYADYYHEDVTLERGDMRLEGKAEIIEFYRSFHESVDQHIQVLDFIVMGDRISVELLARFEAFADWSHPVAGTMPKGTKRTSHTFVHYQQRDGKFTQIRSALFRHL